MCGIIAFISKEIKTTAGEKILLQYEDQHERGTKGFGLIEINKNKIEIKRSTEPVKATIDLMQSKSPIAIFHHRQPTSTDNKIQQTHPLIITHDELKNDYYIIHNGVIHNDNELFKEHTEELGYAYKTLEKTEYGNQKNYTGYTWTKNIFNDSETFAIELARFLEGLQPEIKTKGSAAFIAISVNKKTGKARHLLWGRNDRNPVEIMETKSGLLIASDIHSKEALQLQPDTCGTLDIQKYFNTKEPIKNIYNLTKIADLKFKEYPVVTTIVKKDIETTTETKTIGFKEEKTKTEKENLEEKIKNLPPREKAFTKMAHKIIENIKEEIEILCLQMAYGPVSEEEITAVVSQIQEILLEKESISSKRIRTYFDNYEKREEDDREKELEKELDELRKKNENNTNLNKQKEYLNG